MSRILLVDDDASLLKLMSMRLRSQGYEVDTADSAEGALDRLRQQRADLVLSDLRMGGMDGLALFERIQSQWLGMPVIIMTAHGTIPDAIQATRSGVFIALNPLTAVICGALLLDEALTVPMLAGGAVILLGIYLCNKPLARGRAMGI